MELPEIKPDGTVSKGKTIHDFCHPCDTEDQLVPAVGFCQDCKHQLCQKCYDAHTIPLVTRKHRLQLLSSTAGAQASPAVIKGTLTCPKHPDKVVEVYCITHDSAVCATCIYKHHKSCDTEDLTAVPDDFYQSNDYTGLRDTLRNYNIILDLIHSDAATNITNTEQSNDDALKELNRVTNMIQKNLITAGKQDKSTDVNNLKDIKAECQAMKSQVTQQQTELQRHEHNNVDLYVTSRHAFKLAETLRANIESISKRNQPVSYSFKPDAFIQTITTAASCLGTIERTTTPTNVPAPIPLPPQPTPLGQNNSQNVTLPQTPTAAKPKPAPVKKIAVPPTPVKPKPAAVKKGAVPPTPAKPKSAAHDSSTTKISARLTSAKVPRMADINVRNSKDETTCRIWGMALLSPNKLLVADFKNECVKCVDTSSNTITSYLRLSGEPRDVTVLPDDLAAVTLPGELNIQILSTTGPLSLINTIKMNGPCRGITSTKDKLIVSYDYADDDDDDGDEARVVIMDFQGHVQHTIQYDQHGESLFQYPWYVAVSSEEGREVIYVSDWFTNTVTKLTMTGQVLLTYTDEDLKSPHGLTVTDDGHVLVCSGGTSQVHLVSPSGAKMKTLISHTDGLDTPFANCADTEQNMIYISNCDQDSLNVYKIE